MRRIIFIVISFVLLYVFNVFCFDEAPVSLTEEDVAKIVSSAPPLPVDLGLELNLKLVDFIDCANPNDPHNKDMKDQGTSVITNGPAGKYRETARHRNAFFAYRYHTEKKDSPHLIVVEYPDDKKRCIYFATHESKFSGKINSDWAVESGVYLGDPLPLSNKMQYHTTFQWPEDKWPVFIVANWIRHGEPAAASRIWVYSIEGGLPPLKVDSPDKNNERLIGGVHDFYLIPVHSLFGHSNVDTAIEHIADYYLYLGHNIVGWPVVSNNTWGFECKIPAWDGGDKNEELDKVLSTFDKKGMGFIAFIELSTKNFKIKGKTYSESKDKAEFYENMMKGFDQFVERYGKYKSLKGIAFGIPDFSPPYGEATLDMIPDIPKFVRRIHEKRKDLLIMSFIGARDLHEEYFNDTWDIINRWEKQGGSWPDYLANEVNKLWKSWGRDPQKFTNIKGFTIVNQYQPDDHSIYYVYGSQQPRSSFYYDLDNSQRRSDMIDTRAVFLWNTFFESHIGLFPGNFWYLKLWVAPAFNQALPYSLEAHARAMEHRDRDIIMVGAWINRLGGYESKVRKFAGEFRKLPPVEMKDVKIEGTSPVKVRTAVYNNIRYISILNTIPFDSEVFLSFSKNEEKVSLTPFELKVVKKDIREGDLKVKGESPTAYIDWLNTRLAEYSSLIEDVKKLNSEAVSHSFIEVKERVQKLINNKEYRKADLELGIGLTAELKLRKRILNPPQIKAGLVKEVPKMDGNLDSWPKGATEYDISESKYIVSHMYFPASWSGPNDLSGRLKLAHDGENLYIGIEVRDNILTEKDGLTFLGSKKGYKEWKGKEVGYEFNWSVELPLSTDKKEGKENNFKYVAIRTSKGYVVEGSISLKNLGLKGGDTFGFLVQMTDDDKTDNLTRAKWARKTAMLFPHDPNFTYWSDARNCGELILEK